jgi:hypothetical protein
MMRREQEEAEATQQVITDKSIEGVMQRERVAQVRSWRLQLR